MCARWQHSLHSAERELISALRSAILCWETWHNRKLHRRHSYKYCAHTHARTLTRLRAVLSFIITTSMREDAGCFNEAKCSLFSWLKMRERSFWLLFSPRVPSRNRLYFNFLLMELSSKVDVWSPAWMNPSSPSEPFFSFPVELSKPFLCVLSQAGLLGFSGRQRGEIFTLTFRDESFDGRATAAWIMQKTEKSNAMQSTNVHFSVAFLYRFWQRGTTLRAASFSVR